MPLLLAFVVFVGMTLLAYAALEGRRRGNEWQQRLDQVGRMEAEAPSPEIGASPKTPGSRVIGPQVRRWLDRNARRRRFSAQIPDTLLLLASTLRAGHSPARAVQIVAEEMPAPVSEEFALAASEIRLGLPAATALARIAERVRSADWDLVVTAVTTQAQTGGNLAEILERISMTVRERVRVESETEALTAEGRLSAAILALLPPVLAALLALRNPRYFEPLLHTPLGHWLIGGALFGQVLGALILRAMLRLDH